MECFEMKVWSQLDNKIVPQLSDNKVTVHRNYEYQIYNTCIQLKGPAYFQYSIFS